MGSRLYFATFYCVKLSKSTERGARESTAPWPSQKRDILRGANKSSQKLS